MRRLRVFKQRKPELTNEWEHKLPDFVLRLEEAVYRGARSKVRGFDRRARRTRRLRRARARVMTFEDGRLDCGGDFAIIG